jgi:cellobiose-specific phosphotransferase system component IIA
MEQKVTKISPEEIISSASGINKTIVEYLGEASAHHNSAINHLEKGDYKKAAQCSLLAHECINLASEVRRSGNELL